MHKRFSIAIYIAIGLIFTTYLTVRAVIIPVTIDEAGTYYNYALKQVSEIVTYSGDPSPNNHIVNTLAVKLSTELFGLSAIALRLPNLLAFILFYIVLVTWLKRLRNETWFVLFGLLLVLANPYLLDFFSLARGYGISIAFMTASLFYVYRFYVENNKQSALFACSIAAIAVYANFNLLTFYACLTVLLFTISCFREWHQPLSNFIKRIYPILIITVLLAMMCYLPITKMLATNQFVYWGVDGFYTSTLIPLVDASRYGQDYAGLLSVPTLAIITILIYVGMICYFIITCIKQPKQLMHLFSFWIWLLLTGIILLIYIQFLWLDIPFLNARGALFLYPLFVLIGIIMVHELLARAIAFKPVYILPIAILALLHLSLSVNIHSFREWWFDAHTKDVLAAVTTDSKQEVTSLNTHWIFNNSLRMHLEMYENEKIKLAPFHNDLWPDSNYVYYYCERTDVAALSHQYQSIKEFDYGNYVLMKRKVQD